MHLAILLLACSGSETGPRVETRTDSITQSVDGYDSSAIEPTDTGEKGMDTGTKPIPDTDAIVLKKTPRNLLVISLDTTRRDRVGFFTDRFTTPNLEAAFSGGVILEDHRSCSNWTAPSTYCAQSGNFEFDQGVWPTALAPGDHDERIDWPPRNNPTLASILTDAGFDTTLLTSNSMFSLDINGAAFGFQNEIRELWNPGPTVTDRAIAESKNLGVDGNRWYFHVHYIDPHENYEAPQSYWTDPKLNCAPWDMTNVNVLSQLMGGALWTPLEDRARVRARECLLNVYEGELRYWDQELARLWTHFDSAGLLDDTLVVFWTDHGQSFAEHDNQFNHGVTLYDTETRSTAAFWAKDIEPLRWSGPTIHQDIAPTILNALDVPLGDHTGIVLGHAPEDRVRVAFDYLVGYSKPMISAVQGDLKLMYRWDGVKHFYDLAVDPDEEVDQYDENDPDVIRLWKTLQPLVEQSDEQWPGFDPVAPGP